MSKTLKKNQFSPDKRKEARVYVKAHAEGEPAVVPNVRLNRSHYFGEGQISGRHLVDVNRCDTPKQNMAGEPIVLNTGESIFTTWPRRVNEGKTIRCGESMP